MRSATMSAATTSTVQSAGEPTVELRAMRHDDRDRLLRFHHALSPETVYLRFFSVHPELQPAEVERFTQVDHEQREAIVAVVDGGIVGVGRFDRMSPDSAEVAFVVADDWQGRGLGKKLFASLVIRAGEVGIHHFVADTLPHNERMLSVFRHCGYRYRSTYEDGVVHVDIDLRHAADDARAAPSR